MGVPYTNEQIKKLRLVDQNGLFVHIDKVTPKGKVSKLPNLLERASLQSVPDSLFEKYKDLKLTNYSTIYIKPLSVNECWRGKRFKTPKYNSYHSAVSLLLPNELIVPEGLLRVHYEFGMSTNSDFDNPVKPFTDILQAVYKFNDRNIMDATVRKVVVKKGQEYIKFKIESL